MNRRARGLIVLHVVSDRMSNAPEQITERAFRAQDIGEVTPVDLATATRMGIPSANALAVIDGKRAVWTTERIDQIVNLVNERVDGTDA